MKKYLILMVVALALLTLVACADEVPLETPYVSDIEDIPDEPSDVPDAVENDVNPHIPIGPAVIDSGNASWIVYRDAEDLASRATDIVRAEVLDERVEWFDATGGYSYPPWYVLFTVYRVSVLEVFQGNAQPGDIMELAQEGGELDDVIWHSRDWINFGVGDELVFFARQNAPHLPGIFLNPWQSVYHATALNDAAASDGARGDIFSMELEPVNPEPHLYLPPEAAITIGDMVEVMIENFGYEAAMELEWVDAAELQEYLARR